MNTRDLVIPPKSMECFIYADGLLWPLQTVTVAIPDDNALPIGTEPNSPHILVFIAADVAVEPPEHLKQTVQEVYAQAELYRHTIE